MLLLFIPFAVLTQHGESAGIMFQGHRALAAFQAGAAEGSSSCSSQTARTKESEQAARPWRCRRVHPSARRRPGGVNSWVFANLLVRHVRATFSAISSTPAQRDGQLLPQNRRLCSRPQHPLLVTWFYCFLFHMTSSAVCCN